ncbi:WASH complex subunit 4 [Schistocerca nitens]|uniref:WASH complex subunit 4 n=1 Tax=Schistocerca nitens TaxID=7011 RepID=UPI002118A616|nr:WASH complex subunit 4 [Schistocerca nitens]
MFVGPDWDYDKTEDGCQKIAGELQLRKYGKFLEDYGNQLKGIEAALAESICSTLDCRTDPVGIKLSPHENTSLLQIIDTDNKVLNKVVTVFASLCKEVRCLQADASDKYYNALLFYGEGVEEGTKNEAAQLMISRLLPDLQSLACFLKRCEQVEVNIIQQIAALYPTTKDVPQVINATDIHFQDVFEHLGDLLLILVTLDEIISTQSTLHNHWSLFKRTIKSVHHDPTKFGVPPEKLKTFEKMLCELENQLLTGKIFQRAVEQAFDDRKPSISKNTALAEEFDAYIRSTSAELEARQTEKLDSESALLWVKTSALYVLNFHLFGSLDKKVFKQLWDFSKKVPAASLYGYVTWYPERFLLTHIPAMSKLYDKKAQQNLESLRLNYLQQKTVGVVKDSHIFSLQVCCWMIQMEALLKSEHQNLKIEDISHRCNVFLQGVQYACWINHIVKTVTNLHVSLSKPMTKTEVMALCRLIELLKGIQHTYHVHYTTTSETVNHIFQLLSYQALIIITNVKKGLVQDKRYSEKHLDILSALVLAERVLHGCGTKDRRLVLRLAICAANQGHTFRDDSLASLVSIVYRLNVICELQERIAEVCNCSFMYWHRVILPIYFEHLYENKADLHRVVYMFCALHDCIGAILKTKHNSSTDVLKHTFSEEVCGYLRKSIVVPLCHSIETDLRLHVHSHLKLEDSNPFNVGVKDNLSLLKVQPIRFMDYYIDIKGYVEHYLDETFYNLTTVALHDWKTYKEMRTLARNKFGLVTVEDHLPSQTLEQGLDVLEIMRNINEFVCQYLYNLNNQIFIQHSSSNKHLNTINIRHIANSIRTHGTGIMNTAVNFTYQFLRKKFFIFSQFMYDEHIKSRLIKDIRYFRENKNQLESKYPFDRAEKFNRGIRKLGLTADGQSYLDKFRTLISHIGNAMGYVQMIRSGGLHCCSNATSFIPDLDDVLNFEDLCEEEGLSRECCEAAKRLDQVISNLTRNFAEGTEYFKLLVDVFAPTFRDPKNIHLRNFFAIIPPLTINFIEHSITSKEKMSKKNKVGAAFTDDGFAMGIAYILKLLDQHAEFDSLHWFQSVRDKYSKDKAALTGENSVVSKDDEKLQQTMTLTAKRLDAYKQEFDLLYYTLSSARIFFQKDSVPLEQDSVKYGSRSVLSGSS